MRYALKCASVHWDDKTILDKYPIIQKYNPVLDHPYPNKNVERVTIDVDDLIDFYYDIGYPIILENDDMDDEKMLCLTIYDDYIE